MLTFSHGDKLRTAWIRDDSGLKRLTTSEICQLSPQCFPGIIYCLYLIIQGIEFGQDGREFGSPQLWPDKRQVEESMTQSHSTLDSTCPVCRSREVRSASFHGIAERVLLRLMRIYPFWCNDCFRRFYLFFPKPQLCRQESGSGVSPQ